MRILNASNMIIAHLNINFLYNKFEGLKNLIHGKIDLLILSETKINDSFTTNQFLIEGFSPPLSEKTGTHMGVAWLYM